MIVDVIPENFYTNNELTTTEYNLYINGIRSGYVSVDVSTHKNYITVSHIVKKYRGLGFGKMLYMTALENQNKISTYYHRSTVSAQRVWDSLIKTYAYRTYFFEDSLTVYNRKK